MLTVGTGTEKNKQNNNTIQYDISKTDYILT